MLCSLGAPKTFVEAYKAIPTFYRKVQYIPKLAKSDADLLEISVGYAEQRRKHQLDLNDWKHANENWIILSQEEDFDRGLLERVQHSSSLGQLLKACETDEHIREATIEFVRKAIKYSEETGKIVDIIGKKNAVFLDGKLLLHDALFTENNLTLKNAAMTFRKIVEGKDITSTEIDIHDRCYMLNELANSLNYVRAINALAHALGIKERIESFKISQPVPWKKVFSLVNQYWESFETLRLSPFPDQQGRKFRILY